MLPAKKNVYQGPFWVVTPFFAKEFEVKVEAKIYYNLLLEKGWSVKLECFESGISARGHRFERNRVLLRRD